MLIKSMAQHYAAAHAGAITTHAYTYTCAMAPHPNRLRFTFFRFVSLLATATTVGATLEAATAKLSPPGAARNISCGGTSFPPAQHTRTSTQARIDRGVGVDSVSVCVVVSTSVT